MIPGTETYFYTYYLCNEMTVTTSLLQFSSLCGRDGTARPLFQTHISKPCSSAGQ